MKRSGIAAAALTATCAISLLSSPVSGFYMPGVHPLTFTPGDEVPMKVNAMTSIRTQLPRDYYRLPFCQPTGGPKMSSENLGEFLTGNKVQNSPYTINMLREVYCQILCQVKLDKYEAKSLKMHIQYGYHNNWIIDNLPSASLGLSEIGQKQKHYAGGFPLGFVSSEDKSVYIYNHVKIVIDYHRPETTSTSTSGYRVVGFAVEPMSIEHRFLGGYEWDGESSDGYTKQVSTCTAGDHMDRNDILTNQIVEVGEKILYTYDVKWVESPVTWASRWDVYLNEDHLVPAKVHWYSIVNSIMVVFFLSLLVISILVRNLKRDIAGYNAGYNAVSVLVDEEDDDEEDETGWKLVHADVFRPPSTFPLIYCAFVGTGTQIAFAALFSIIFSAIGFLNPARRGSLMIAVLLFYMISGCIAGYVSSRLYKAFRGRQWQLCTIATATIFPGTCFVVFLFFNIILFFFHSSASVPFLDVIIVASLWCCVSIPLVFMGAFFGYKQESIEFPTNTSSVARQIPEPTNFLLNPKLCMIAAGLGPFAATYVELFFIMTSLWMDQFYYVFGFTLIVYFILIVTCAEMTILVLYWQLCAENHRWWWFTFFTAGSTSLYTMVYSIFWFQGLQPSRMMITYMLYFGYMFLISYGILLLTGAIGVLSGLWFTRKIFGSIKVD
uniref:Transmembrane 9 superfamily member n=1 Tax=Ditylum brightwellii TaxID=49249 RepID=A0A7S1YQJ7_9STRA|mmetsp:Transcript_1391/g.2258  ORF Transcript_1391/g.2258 Transcript_1391/m.2258 type:complete len:664 (+) Transcript_1391:111-2102(+)